MFAVKVSRMTIALFVQVGRDFQSSKVAHKFVEKEKKRMAGFETLDYQQPQSIVYKQSVERRREPSAFFSWMLYFLIGICVATVCFLLKQSIEFLSENRLEETIVCTWVALRARSDC